MGLSVNRSDAQRVAWHVQAVLAKGFGHLLSLGRWHVVRAVQRARSVWSSRMVDEKTFLAQFTLPHVRQALQRGDLAAAKKAVVHHFRSRTWPMFCFDHLEMQNTTARIEGADKQRMVAKADEICHHVFQFRGEPPIAFYGSVNWFHCPRGNVDWTWELNRHAYFFTLGCAYAYTGDERYAREFRDLLLDWLSRNPVGLDEPNWSSMLEVAYRINIWLWAYHYFLVSPSFDDEALLACLRGLWVHVRYLAANLEYHVRNNHLLLESKALAMCGLLFPEFRDAGVWRDRGLSTLWQQMRQQVRPDGVHAEQATMYHQIITSELFELFVLLDNNDIGVPPDIVNLFTRMLEFERAVTKPSGRIPLIGDSAFDDSYVRFSALAGGAALLDRGDLTIGPLDEATVWLIGPERARRWDALPHNPTVQSSQAFPDGGYFFMRCGEGQDASYLVFDCGPFGYRPAPGHGHADALSFELHGGGRTLVIDPGVYSYHLGERWRDYFRSTRAHNTIVVDGRDQSVLLDGWHVHRPAQATLHCWTTGSDFDLSDGSHDGYRRLPAPVTHRRQILYAKPEYWVVVDTLTGEGEHSFDLYFHLGPGAEPSLDSATGTLYATYDSEVYLAIVPLATPGVEAQVVQGQTDPVQGWISRFSGEKHEAPVLCYRCRGRVPVQLCTLLYPGQAGKTIPLAVLPLEVVTSDGRLSGDATLTGLEIRVGTRIDYLVLDRCRPRALKLFAGCERDGSVIFVKGHGVGEV